MCRNDFFFFYGNSMSFMEKEMASLSSMPAQRIPWTEEPGELQSMGLQTVRHDLVVKQQQQQQQQQGVSSAMSKLILTVRRVLKQLGL